MRPICTLKGLNAQNVLHRAQVLHKELGLEIIFDFTDESQRRRDNAVVIYIEKEDDSLASPMQVVDIVVCP
jgi:hypothetical protein